jgi:signal recognition particle subunit SRP54
VKFVGVGEKYDAIEPFFPDRIAQRILGMGDVLSLIEEVQGKIDEKDAQEQLRKMTSNQFTLEDFSNQLRQFKKLGSMSKLMKMLPEQLTGGIQITDEQSEVVDKQMHKTEAIIGSMTKQERSDHKVIDASRKTRIANGSGSTIADVNQLIRQYEQMKKMMAQMNRGGGLLGGLGKKMMGGMAGGLGGMLGGLGGGDMGLGSGDDDFASNNGAGQATPPSNRIKKKKRHKKRH